MNILTSQIFLIAVCHVGNDLKMYPILETDWRLGKVLYPEGGWALGQAHQGSGHSIKPDRAQVLDNAHSGSWWDSCVLCRARSWMLIVEDPFQLRIFYDFIILEYVSIWTQSLCSFLFVQRNAGTAALTL